MSILSQFMTTQQPGLQSGLSGSTADTTIVALSDLVYHWPGASKPLLNIRSLQVEKGQRVFIQGPSGSGKSTLLSLLAGVISPQQGYVSILGQRIDRLSNAGRDRFRADHIGFIFQMFNLLPYLSVIENVSLPCRFSHQRHEKAQQRSGGVKTEALHLLEHLDMSDPDLLKRPVTDLSVGQQQRVAAARALMGRPEILIADEPTSSLDADLRQEFIHLLFEESRINGITLIFVSHDMSLASLFDRTVSLPEINRAGGGAQGSEREVR